MIPDATSAVVPVPRPPRVSGDDPGYKRHHAEGTLPAPRERG